MSLLGGVLHLHNHQCEVQRPFKCRTRHSLSIVCNWAVNQETLQNNATMDFTLMIFMFCFLKWLIVTLKSTVYEILWFIEFRGILMYDIVLAMSYALMVIENKLIITIKFKKFNIILWIIYNSFDYVLPLFICFRSINLNTIQLCSTWCQRNSF